MTRRARSLQARFGLETENVTGNAVKRRRLELFPQMTGEMFCNHLAQTTGFYMNIATLSKIERGKRCVMDYELHFLARCLGVTMDELIDSEFRNQTGSLTQGTPNS
ncbi:helix-turn-helix domain-containing protein [Deinococcus sp. QL22]|uniref:helix-turn-helix domain-containing protein n=1 Tax=Deinococcus sp. QL22 TaxID=2939437 RepID=UPI0020174CBA|nr:helix-turn-helix transcriptional regulator [Deinococcus sp. QL22]UQN10656.1 helix-turn-helix domain-containing protein [Deinococcus sp. QL22]